MNCRLFVYIIFTGMLSMMLLSCTEDRQSIVAAEQGKPVDVPAMSVTSTTGENYSFSLNAGAILYRPGNVQEWRATFEAKAVNSLGQDVRGSFDIEISVQKNYFASGPVGGWVRIDLGTSCGTIKALGTSDGEWDKTQFIWRAKAHFYSAALGINLDLVGSCYFYPPEDQTAWDCSYFHYDPPNAQGLAGYTIQQLTADIQGDRQIYIPGKNQGTVTPQWTAAASGGSGSKTYEWYISYNGNFTLAGTGQSYSRSYSYDGSGADSYFQLKLVVTDATGSANCIIDVLEDRIPYSAD